MVNRLAEATSPYLLQHAENPVDWWEWSPEALAEATRTDRPILLSVGYAACHWCHVMAHESFEDPATAAFMNEHFVNIKVDREERPDIDAIYMRATQAMTGQGGWPMTCVLNPEGEPFFAGTYFPPEPRNGQPAFTQILQALATAWLNDREQVTQVGSDVRRYLSEAVDTASDLPTGEDLDRAKASLWSQFDEQAGGFGGSPKFPPSMVLEFLLRQHVRTGDPQSLEAVERTCEAMARGGLYDQLGGGFARYSVDRFWRVPHFEKMLYDNAMLLRVYLHWWRLTGSPLAERISRETARFIANDFATDEGGFAAAFDADSEGHEGTYYAWSRAQLEQALDVDDAAWAAQLLGVTEEGTFERGLSTLQLLDDPDDEQRWRRVRATLVASRVQRVLPDRDDKVVAAWNGFAITALAEAGVMLDDHSLTNAAVIAANLLVQVHLDGPFVRTSRDSTRSAHGAVLEDYGAVAEAFLAVLGATGDAVWLERAQDLLDQVLDRFTDPSGGFFDVANDAEKLLVRPKDASDNASPSGNSAAAHAFLAAAAITGDQRYREAAESAVAAAAALVNQAPRFAGWTLAAAEALLAGPMEIAVVGDVESRGVMHQAALMSTSPGAVVVAGEPGLSIPLFDHRTLLDDKPTAYVCHNFVCRQPTTDPQVLERV